MINSIRKYSKIRLSLILGSGIKINSDLINYYKVIYREKGGVHSKKILLCKIRGRNVMIFQGRRHYYEGYDYSDLVTNVRIAAEAGSGYVLLTNAAGGINGNLEIGDLMLINSYINFNPMLKVPAVKLLPVNYFNKIIESASVNVGIYLKKGTYCYCTGPQYETNAEIRFLSKLGTDAVGMSTLPEFYELNRSGIMVSAISCITNVLKPDSKVFTSHNEVLINARKCSSAFSELVDAILCELK